MAKLKIKIDPRVKQIRKKGQQQHEREMRRQKNSLAELLKSLGKL